jgi:hypothetical protein
MEAELFEYEQNTSHGLGAVTPVKRCTYHIGPAAIVVPNETIAIVAVLVLLLKN